MYKPRLSFGSILIFFIAVAAFSETIKNIDYAGTGKVEHTLNIYAPDGDGPFPVVIHYPGLAYSWSDAKSDGGLASSYNAAGFIVVGGNVSGGGSGSHMARYPAQIQELKATVRFLRANAEKYRIDPDFIGVIGFSSGAWNSVMLATTGDVDEHTAGSATMNLEGDFGGNLEFSSRVQAAWAAAPPTDFLAMDGCGSMLQHNPANSPEGGLIGGQLDQNRDKCALANPITFISRDDPPIHLVHGTADNIVPTCQSELMWAALQESDNEKESSYSPVGGGHQANFGGSLEFFQEALAANKEGCLDPENENFDPLATYCSTGDCCEETAVAKSPEPAKRVLSVGYSRSKSAEAIEVFSPDRHSLQIFDASGMRIMAQSGSGKANYSLKEVRRGVYFVRVSVKGRTSIDRIVRF